MPTIRSRAVVTMAALVGVTVSAGPPPTPRDAPAASLQAVEDAFAELRRITDRIELASARGVGRATSGEPVAELAGRWPKARARVEARIAALEAAMAAGDSPEWGAGTRGEQEVAGAPPCAEDRAALAEMRRVLESELSKAPHVAADSRATAATPDCRYDAAAIAAQPEGLEALTARVYACFGHAAANLSLNGRPLDRLTILGLLGTTEDPDQRRRLFRALEPVWRSVNGDGGPRSPYRRLLTLRARDPEIERGLLARKAQELGLAAEDVERWIVAILEAWRAARPKERVEPWDFYYANGAASRALGARVALAGLRPLNDRFYRDLGADVAALGVHYDLDPRPGKTPVAFTTFGGRGRARAGAWEPTQPWVFATYRIGGLDNLAELLHETGHAVHLAAIRARPAWLDWPDNDTFTEAVADLAAADLYEPEWQRKYLGASAAPASGVRARYASVVMDAAWALFELRVHRDRAPDPSRVWAEITSEYLGIAPHPEWSWWALRGQLIESPGYLANYAVGAVLTADLRARTHRERGPSAAGDPGWYAWVSERLFRFGRARPARDVVQSFLGRPPSPEALLADLRRTTPADQ